MENKKPFWETKIGKVISGAKGLLPDKGVLGVLKNLIDSDDTLTPEEKENAREHLLEAYKQEVKDRESARNREARVKATGDSDIMMLLTGIVGLSAFLFVLYVTVFMPESADSKAFMRIEGIIEGIVISNIFAYYYGTSYKK